MYFSFSNILPAVWICLAVSLAAMAFLLTVFRNFTRLRSTQPARPEEDGTGTDDLTADNELPGVSVIIYARDNASDLRQMLPEVLAQQYPEDKMEVIVVNDGSVDDVTDVVNYLSQQYHNLYITFVPDEAHNLSRKKLAISLGIKAARKEVVLLTTAESRPASDRWLRGMTFPMRNAAGGGKDVVLGWAKIDCLRRPMLKFDQVARATTWLSAALRHRPYRGTGFNIAYRRELFFQAKGFSRSLNLHNGDDDIFINQITTPENTAVVLSSDTTVTVNFQRPDAAFRDLVLRHCFTGRRLPKGARRMMASGTWATWLWLAATATGITFSLPNWYPACIFLATIPALWIPLTINWMRTGQTLSQRLNPAIIWWEMFWRWLFNLKCNMECGSKKRRNFTWHQKK